MDSEILINISVTLRATFQPPSAPSAYEENRPLPMLTPPEHVLMGGFISIKPPWLYKFTSTYYKCQKLSDFDEECLRLREM